MVYALIFTGFLAGAAYGQGRGANGGIACMEVITLPHYSRIAIMASLSGQVVVQVSGPSNRFQVKSAPHPLLSKLVAAAFPTWRILDECKRATFDLIFVFHLRALDFSPPWEVQRLEFPNTVRLSANRLPQEAMPVGKQGRRRSRRDVTLCELIERRHELKRLELIRVSCIVRGDEARPIKLRNAPSVMACPCGTLARRRLSYTELRARPWHGIKPLLRSMY